MFARYLQRACPVLRFGPCVVRLSSMRSQFSLVSLATPLVAVGFWASIPGHADSRKLAELPPLPVIPDVSAEPSSTAVASAQTPPLPPAPPPLRLEKHEIASVRRGDSLASFLSRHGLTLEQLKSFNPGLEVSDLTIGRVVRVAEGGAWSIPSCHPPSDQWWRQLAGYPRFPLFVRPHPCLFRATQPGQQKVFTSGYGWRWGRMHKGIDIANNTGTPIHAARKGVVTYSGWSGAYGYLVEIAHADGESTRYAHNSRLLVKKGQVVPWNADLTDGQHRSQHRPPSSLRDPSQRRCCCQSSRQTPPTDSLIVQTGDRLKSWKHGSVAQLVRAWDS